MVLGGSTPEGFMMFRSVTGVSDGVIIDNVFCAVRGNEWFPTLAASLPEDEVVRSKLTSSVIMY